MTQDLILLHHEGPERFDLSLMAPTAGLEVFSFMTCLRHIVIVDQSTAHAVAQLAIDDSRQAVMMRGEEAYRFLLEVICGLHSPLVGETEVYGQFKTAVAKYQTPLTPWGSFISKTFKSLFEDAKKIRDTHLKDLGSQSYGSVLRREVRGLKRLHILGAGQLVRELLPWVLKDSLRVTIHCRDVEKARRDLNSKLDANQMGRIEIADLYDRSGPLDADALVVAAPLAGTEIIEWLSSRTSLQFIADLRAESSVDRIDIETRVLELGEFMSRVSFNQSKLLERKDLALQAIATAALERARHVENRPFGWEDVCA